MSTEKNVQKDLLKLYAFSTIANFFVNLGSKHDVDEDEAKSLLRIQNDLIQQFDSTLAVQLDEASMQSFREFVNKYRVRMN
jgi:hypothetical protein